MTYNEFNSKITPDGGLYQKTLEAVRDGLTQNAAAAKKRRRIWVTAIAAAALIASGAAAVTGGYIFKKPQAYDPETESEITQSDVDIALTEDKAREIGKKTLEKLGVETKGLEKSFLEKFPQDGKIVWNIDTGSVQVTIDAKTGAFISYTDKSGLCGDDSSVDESEAREAADKLCAELGYKDKDYMPSALENIGNGLWRADFCQKYGEVFNPYQCVRITFNASTQKLVMLRLFDYEFENNPYEITKEQAESIVLGRYADRGYKTVSVKKDIREINYYLYQSENPSPEGQEYRGDGTVRNIWLVEMKADGQDFSEFFYVDGTTGELIGGDMTK